MDDDEAIRLAEAIARDPDLKPTMRLRALETLEKIKRRRDQAAGVAAEEDDGLPPDPMADLDELEQRRRRKAS